MINITLPNSIKCGGGGGDDGAGFGEGGHVAEVDEGVGCLAGDDNQRAALLQLDIGNATNEVIGGARGNPGQSTHCAWYDYEGVRGVGARGVSVVVGVVWG